MRRKLSDFVIMSDLDGTLIRHPNVVSHRNAEALKRFVEKGGRFGIATGRPVGFIPDSIRGLPVNFPSIHVNGGVIYSHQEKKALRRIFLPERTPDYIREIKRVFPGCGVVLVDETQYIDYDGVYTEKGAARAVQPTCICSNRQELYGSYYKTAFLVDDDQIEAFSTYVKEQTFSGVRFSASTYNFYEMIPEGVSKGRAIQWLVEATGVALEQFVAIGDYYNDFEMLNIAGIAATVRSAPDDIKALCDYIVCNCEEDALADLVERLEKDFG